MLVHCCAWGRCVYRYHYKTICGFLIFLLQGKKTTRQTINGRRRREREQRRRERGRREVREPRCGSFLYLRNTKRIRRHAMMSLQKQITWPLTSAAKVEDSSEVITPLDHISVWKRMQMWFPPRKYQQRAFCCLAWLAWREQTLILPKRNLRLSLDEVEKSLVSKEEERARWADNGTHGGD